MKGTTHALSRKGLSVLLSGVLAFSLMGVLPGAAYAAEGDGADSTNPGQTSTEQPTTPSQPATTPSQPATTTPAPAAPAPAATAQPAKPAPAAPLSFANASVTKTLGDKAFTNKLARSDKAKGELTFTSSNKKVATVNAKGKVTIKGVGTTTIKVKSQATKKTKAYTAKYTLTVNPRATKIYYAQGAVKGFGLNWKTVGKKHASGYQLRYADNKAMKGAKKATVRGANASFALVGSLKNEKKYYVQLRVYKRVDGKAYFSAWTKAKAVRAGVHSGNKKLDAAVAKVLSKKSIKSQKTALGKLRAAFNYVAKYPYIRTYDSPKGNWSPSYALQMYKNHGGNCFRYAALFCWLARGLGYDAKAVTGVVPSRARGWAPHGWVEIKLDGRTYICDSEMVHVLRGFNLFMMTYHSAPMTYKKNKHQ